MRKAKTSGLEFIILSIMAFNGSGYADMRSPETFYDSYVAYLTMRKRKEHLELAEVYREEIMFAILHLFQTTEGAGRKPSQKALKRFANFYPPAKYWLDQPLPNQLSLV